MALHEIPDIHMEDLKACADRGTLLLRAHAAGGFHGPPAYSSDGIHEGI